MESDRFGYVNDMLLGRADPARRKLNLRIARPTLIRLAVGTAGLSVGLAAALGVSGWEQARERVRAQEMARLERQIANIPKALAALPAVPPAVVAPPPAPPPAPPLPAAILTEAERLPAIINPTRRTPPAVRVKRAKVEKPVPALRAHPLPGAGTLGAGPAPRIEPAAPPAIIASRATPAPSGLPTEVMPRARSGIVRFEADAVIIQREGIDTPIRVGERFPSGERVVEIRPDAFAVVTDRRILSIVQ